MRLEGHEDGKRGREREEGGGREGKEKRSAFTRGQRSKNRRRTISLERGLEEVRSLVLRMSSRMSACVAAQQPEQALIEVFTR